MSTRYETTAARGRPKRVFRSDGVVGPSAARVGINQETSEPLADCKMGDVGPVGLSPLGVRLSLDLKCYLQHILRRHVEEMEGLGCPLERECVGNEVDDAQGSRGCR